MEDKDVCRLVRIVLRPAKDRLCSSLAVLGLLVRERPDGDISRAPSRSVVSWTTFVGVNDLLLASMQGSEAVLSVSLRHL